MSNDDLNWLCCHQCTYRDHIADLDPDIHDESRESYCCPQCGGRLFWQREPTLIMKDRPVKISGHVHELFVNCGKWLCGRITDGVEFHFDGQGGWCVDLEDLRGIVREADAFRDGLQKRKTK